MSGLLGGSSKLPPVPDPEAIPELPEEAGTDETKPRRKSRKELIVTGDLAPETRKKRLLG